MLTGSEIRVPSINIFPLIFEVFTSTIHSTFNIQLSTLSTFNGLCWDFPLVLPCWIGWINLKGVELQEASFSMHVQSFISLRMSWGWNVDLRNQNVYIQHRMKCLSVQHEKYIYIKSEKNFFRFHIFCLLISISFLWIDDDIVDVVGVFRVDFGADLMSVAGVVVVWIVVCGMSVRRETEKIPISLISRSRSFI